MQGMHSKIASRGLSGSEKSPFLASPGYLSVREVKCDKNIQYRRLYILTNLLYMHAIHRPVRQYHCAICIAYITGGSSCVLSGEKTPPVNPDVIVVFLVDDLAVVRPQFQLNPVSRPRGLKLVSVRTSFL